MYNYIRIAFCCLAGIFLIACQTSRPVRWTGKKAVWQSLPSLPRTNSSDSISLGVSGHFSGITNGCILVAGGCNFPDKPASEGGVKRYYDSIWKLDTAGMMTGQWEKVGTLPHPVAYGASVSVSEGLVCIGGNNDKQSFSSAYLLSWNAVASQVDIIKLPELPFRMDNLAATSSANYIYVAGGNKNGVPANSFLRLNLNQLTKGWEILPDFPGCARLQPVLVSQHSDEGTQIYLSGGFQPEVYNSKPFIPTDLLSFSSMKNEWKLESAVPVMKGGELRTFTGGCAVSNGDSLIYFTGGVNYDRFLSAISMNRNLKLAEKNGKTSLFSRLTREKDSYLKHPSAWYKFNKEIFIYNTFTRKWTFLDDNEFTARAGASLLLLNKCFIIIGGEIKPGIRTPDVMLLRLL